jgi:serine/threonine-protein kinase RsbW
MAGDRPTSYQTTVPAEPDGLEHLHHLIDTAREDRPDVAGDDFDMLETAIIELAGNVAKHGRRAGGTDITLSLAIDDDTLHATLRDAGRQLTVDLHPGMPDEVDEAGRGLAIARSCLDTLTYEHDAGINTWHLERRGR